MDSKMCASFNFANAIEITNFEKLKDLQLISAI